MLRRIAKGSVLLFLTAMTVIAAVSWLRNISSGPVKLFGWSIAVRTHSGMMGIVWAPVDSFWEMGLIPVSYHNRPLPWEKRLNIETWMYHRERQNWTRFDGVTIGGLSWARVVMGDTHMSWPDHYSVPPPSERKVYGRFVVIPDWLIIVPCVSAWLIIFRRQIAAWNIIPDRPGECSNCGYDLRATPDRCPECGTAADGAKSRG
jgi:hypothetical protein